MGRGVGGISRKTGLPRFVVRIRSNGADYFYFRFGPHRKRLPAPTSELFAGTYAALLVEHGLVAISGPQAKSVDRTSVYFIQDGHSGAVKIGVARYPQNRMRELQVGASAQLRLIATVPGGRMLERKLHDDFRHLRIRGEWFLNAPELRSAIKELRGK